ncbi:collagen-like protein [Streptomyces scabiei]|uniref:collagen-like triple helix repeat-containing protein n=1 Tax=Streptomyces scabiei TaxID=1930 RepID=UPI0038F6A968
MGTWWERNIIEPGKLPLLLALTAFVLTFLITRVITRLIRAGKGPFRNISGSGGVHIHHVVPGIVLAVVGGFGSVAGDGHGFGALISAVLFGMGVGLVLDEFALILHLDDVYWSEEGRQSVEVVVLTAALVGLLLVGFLPFGVNDLDEEEMQDRGAVMLTMGTNFLIALIALAKGKTRTAIFGVVIPFIAVVGAVRLARPTSAWARRFYRRRPRARARSWRRAYRHDRRWAGPSRRLQDWLGGTPDRAPALESATRPALPAGPPRPSGPAGRTGPSGRTGPPGPAGRPERR